MTEIIQTSETEFTVDSLRKTKYGAAFQKDTWDLFCSLLVSLKLTTHKRMGFKPYHNSFIGHEALQSLGSLKFIRSPAPVTTRGTSGHISPLTCIAKFSESSAVSLMQQFLAASLIKDVTTTSDRLIFKQKRIYEPTTKGLYILETFLQICALDSDVDRFADILSSRPTPRLHLCRLERSQESDELVLDQRIILNLFRSFVGYIPNYVLTGQETGVELVPFNQRTDKLLKEQFKRQPQALEGKISSATKTHCVTAPKIIQWLCGNTVMSCPQEAAGVAAHFVLHGFLVFIIDKSKKNDKDSTFTATGLVTEGSATAMATAEFRYTQESIYAITDKGSLLTWKATNRMDDRLVEDALMLSLNDQARTPSMDVPSDLDNAARLKSFIKNPSMLTLFREYLSEQHCEYSLAFWIDVEDFKVEFGKASNARPPPVDEPPLAGSSSTPVEPFLSTSQSHESLSNIPIMIYNAYLAPSSTYKLGFDIGHDLQKELEISLEHCVDNLTNNLLDAEAKIFGPVATLNIDQLTILVWLYERIQNRVFATLADDFVPKFLLWSKFVTSAIDSLSCTTSV